MQVFRSMKGWIYHDDALIYDSGYQYLEKESALGKILEGIEQART